MVARQRCCDRETAWGWVQTLATEALEGDDDSLRCLPNAIDHALGSRTNWCVEVPREFEEMVIAWFLHCQPGHIRAQCRYCWVGR